MAELRPIPEDVAKVMNEEACVDEQLGSSFRSLLGGIAWTAQTRPDVAAYVASLQRKLQDPCARDILNLNRVLRYLKAKPLSMRIRRLESPWSLVVVSDSAYKSDGVDCLTMRSGLVLLMNKSGIQVGTNHCQPVDFVAKKQTRVCRSTFSLLDLLGHALNINLTLTEVLNGRQKLEALEEIHEQGTNVQDSVASAEVKTPGLVGFDPRAPAAGDAGEAGGKSCLVGHQGHGGGWPEQRHNRSRCSSQSRARRLAGKTPAKGGRSQSEVTIQPESIGTCVTPTGRQT